MVTERYSKRTKSSRKRRLNFWTLCCADRGYDFGQSAFPGNADDRAVIQVGSHHIHPTFSPRQLSLESFNNVLTKSNFLMNMVNSLKIALIVTVACIIFSLMAGYAISRFRGRIFSLYTTFMLILQLFPGVLMLIPLFVIFRVLGLIDNHLSVILAYTASNLPFSIWLLKGFFDSIPDDIEQAGMIDGCSRFSTFWRLVVPISMPGISTVAIFTFINAWGEFTVASILVRRHPIWRR